MSAESSRRPSLLEKARSRATRAQLKLWAKTGRPLTTRAFHRDLIVKTGNFGHTTWVGLPIWQNVLDLWTIQETIAEIKPALLIETGTNRGGSALFYAHLMDLLGEGEIVTVDIVKLHELEHPRVEFLIGSSTDPQIVERVKAKVDGVKGPVMVILDGNHDRDHVAQELELYGPMVTPGSLLLSQDGIIDQVGLFRDTRPGPLPANEAFLRGHPEFEHDRERNERFLLTHHPVGWLRRKPS